MDERKKQLLKDLEQYIQKNWAAPENALLPENPDRQETKLPVPDDKDSMDTYSKDGIAFPEKKNSLNLEDLINEVGDSFHEVLFDKISQSGMTDVEVYKRANIDRKLFSKIRSNPAYHPRKATVLALAIALKLNLEETQDLLSRAEYALSPGSKSDVIIRYFIEKKEYDIDLINIALDDHGLAILE